MTIQDLSKMAFWSKKFRNLVQPIITAHKHVYFNSKPLSRYKTAKIITRFCLFSCHKLYHLYYIFAARWGTLKLFKYFAPDKLQDDVCAIESVKGGRFKIFEYIIVNKLCPITKDIYHIILKEYKMKFLRLLLIHDDSYQLNDLILYAAESKNIQFLYRCCICFDIKDEKIMKSYSIWKMSNERFILPFDEEPTLENRIEALVACGNNKGIHKIAKNDQIKSIVIKYAVKYNAASLVRIKSYFDEVDIANIFIHGDDLISEVLVTKMTDATPGLIQFIFEKIAIELVKNNRLFAFKYLMQRYTFNKTFNKIVPQECAEHAAARGGLEILKLLFDHLSPKMFDANKLFNIALENNHEMICRYLCDHDLVVFGESLAKLFEQGMNEKIDRFARWIIKNFKVKKMNKAVKNCKSPFLRRFIKSKL